MKTSVDALTQLIQQGESETLEFKASFQKEVLESIAAFANTRGGKVLLGVGDTGELLGLQLSHERLHFKRPLQKPSWKKKF